MPGHSQGLMALFERFRGILHEGVIDKRVQYMIEGLFAVRKTNFSECVAAASPPRHRRVTAARASLQRAV